MSLQPGLESTLWDVPCKSREHLMWQASRIEKFWLFCPRCTHSSDKVLIAFCLDFGIAGGFIFWHIELLRDRFGVALGVAQVVLCPSARGRYTTPIQEFLGSRSYPLNVLHRCWCHINLLGCDSKQECEDLEACVLLSKFRCGLQGGAIHQRINPRDRLIASIIGLEQLLQLNPDLENRLAVLVRVTNAKQPVQASLLQTLNNLPISGAGSIVMCDERGCVSK